MDAAYSPGDEGGAGLLVYQSLLLSQLHSLSAPRKDDNFSAALAAPENATAANGDDYDTELFVGYSNALLQFATVCCVTFIIVGIPGNLITIVALFRCKKVRNATAVFIINLSVSDLMFCCFNLPLAASVFQQRAWRHGHLLCRLFPLVRYALMAVSLFTVLAITINRYVMIGHPRLYPKLYRRRWLALMVACTWLFGFGALIATWVGAWGRFGLDTQVGSCSIRPDAQGRSPKEFLFIVAFVIPCLAIVVCYARIFYIVRKTALKSRGSGPSAGSSGVLSGGGGGGGGRKGIIAAMGPLSSSGFDETTTTTGGGSQSVRHCALQSPEDTVSRPLRSNTSIMQNGHQRLLLLAVPPSPRTSPNRHRLAEPSSSSGIELSHAGSYVDDDDGLPSGSATPTSFCSNDRRRTSRSPSTTAISSALSQVAAVFTRSRTPGVNVVNSSPISARRYSNNNLSAVPVPGKMTAKDKKLLKMILVIFASFVICYLPITISKTFRSVNDMHGLNIAGYILIYLSTCINPIIYVVMSSEYRQAYKNLLMCRGSSGGMYHNNEAGATAAPGAGALLQQQHLARNMSQRA